MIKFLAVAVASYAFYEYWSALKRDENKEKQLSRTNLTQETTKTKTSRTKYPDLSNKKAVQRFFHEQITLGETLLVYGQIEEGIHHISNSIAIYSEPKKLIQVYHKEMPPQIVEQIMIATQIKLNEVQKIKHEAKISRN